MAYPITLHLQVKDDVTSQAQAESLRYFLANSQVRQALDDSGIVQFMRVLLVPLSRVTQGIEGVFAVQVIIVYDGELDTLLDYFWNSAPIQPLFRTISDVAKRPAADPWNMQNFKQFVKDNNLNPKARELRKAYNLTVQQIKEAFSEP